MNKCYSLCLFVFVVSASLSAAQDQNYKTLWKPTVNQEDIGKGDLNRTYDDLLEYLLPRRLASQTSHNCYLIVRYLPSNKRPHQLNLLLDKTGIVSAWAFELPSTLQLQSSDQGQKIAEATQVTTWRVEVSQRMNDLVLQRLERGFLFALRPGIVLHGDAYRMWGNCDLSEFNYNLTVPANTSNSSTSWMNHLWTQAKSRGF